MFLTPPRPVMPPTATSVAVIPIASRKPERSSLLSAPATAAPTTAMPSSPATRATALLTPLAMPGVPLARIGEHGRGQRRDDHREADREDDERGQELLPVVEPGLQPDQRHEQRRRATSGPMPMK